MRSSRRVPARFAGSFPTRRSGISGRPRTTRERPPNSAPGRRTRGGFHDDDRSANTGRQHREGPHRPVSRRQRAHGAGRPRRAAHGRCVRPAVLPHHFAGRAVDGAGAARGRDRLRLAAVRERRAAAAAGAAAGAGHPRPLRRARHRRAAGSGRRDAAGAPRRRAPAEHRALYRQAVVAHRTASARGAPSLASERLPALRDYVRRREAHLGAELFRPALSRGVSRRRRSATTIARSSARSGRPSRASWRRNRACCAIATITAAT